MRPSTTDDSAHVSVGPGRALEETARDGGQSGHISSKARDLCVLCLMERIIPFDVAVVWGSSGSSAGHSAEQHSRYLLPDRQRHVRQNPQRSTITDRRYGTGSSPRTLYRVHPLSPHIVSSEMRLGNASLTADLERLLRRACVVSREPVHPASRCFERFALRKREPLRAPEARKELTWERLRDVSVGDDVPVRRRGGCHGGYARHPREW